MFLGLCHRRVTVLALLVVVAVIVAACGGGSGPSQSTTGSEALGPTSGAQGGGTSGTASEAAEVGNEIVVGFSSILTGLQAAAGIGAVKGFTTYFEQLVNSKGGVHGRKVKVVSEDNKYEPAAGTASARKLVDADKAFMLVCIGTAPCLAEIPVAEQNGVPLIIVGADAPMFDPPKQWVWAAGTPYEHQAALAVEYIVKDLGAGKPKLGTMVLNDALGEAIKKGVHTAAEHFGLEVVIDQQVPRGTTDVSAEMLKVKEADPDYLILGTTIGDTSAALTAAYQLKLRAKLFGSSDTSAYTTSIKNAGKEASAGYHSVQSISGFKETNLPGMKQLVEIGQQKDPDMIQQGNQKYVHGWGIAAFVAEALSKAGPDLTRAKLQDALNSLKEFDSGGPLPPATFAADKKFMSTAAKVYEADVEQFQMMPVSDWRFPEAYGK